MNKKYTLVPTDAVKLLRGSFKLTSQSGDTSIGYGMKRGYAKAILILGDVKLGP